MNPSTEDSPLRAPSSDADGTPWIETRSGGLFFVNVLLVTPAAVALAPALAGLLLRTLGVIEGPSRLFDTVPRLAWYFLPRLGVLALPAAWVAWKGLGEVERKGARRALILFLLVHAGTLALTVWRWTTG